jgi:hypothetical protein
VFEDASIDLSSTVAEIRLDGGAVLHAIVAEDLSDVVHEPYAKLLVGKAVKRYWWGTGNSSQSVELETPEPVEEHLRRYASGRQPGVHMVFTDGSSFGEGWGSIRYVQAAEEDDDILRSYGLASLTNANSGLAKDKYWKQASVVELENKVKDAVRAASKMCNVAILPYDFCGGSKSCSEKAGDDDENTCSFDAEEEKKNHEDGEDEDEKAEYSVY